MLRGNERETFAISDHRSSSYSAADFNVPDNCERVSFLQRRLWCLRRRPALVLSGIAVLIIGFWLFGGESEPPQETEYNYENIYRKRSDNETTISGVPPAAKHINLHDIRTPENDTPLIHADQIHRPSTRRLSRDNFKYLLEPLHYEIYIKPFIKQVQIEDFGQFTFRGNVSIIFHTSEALNCILIGASNLRIASTTLVKLQDFESTDKPKEIAENIDVSIEYYDTDDGTLSLQLNKFLVPYEIYELRIIFNGNIQNLTYGLFQSYYKDPSSGEISWLVGTNLDIPFARTVFPCFDVPTLTATYQLNVARKENTTVDASSFYWLTVNETNYEKAREDDKYVWEQYLKTPEIPVHLLAFVVTNFYSEVTMSAIGRRFTVWTATKRTDEISYVMDIGPRLLTDIQSYLGVSLPVRKINIFGLPQVMPHQKAKMGMIYVSESDISIYEGRTSEMHKEHVAKTLASHLIEQWIEGLIVFEWDADEWIKESLVQYLKYIAVDFVEPNWQMANDFFVNVQQVEMDYEIVNPLRKPMYIRWLPHMEPAKMHYIYPVNETTVFKMNPNTSADTTPTGRINPRIYNQLHERKSTDKGACLFRMIQHMVSEPVFKTAIQNFLHASREDLVKGDDLWNMLTEEARGTTYEGYKLLPEGVTLLEVIEDWINSEGYPMILVTRDYVEGAVMFSQFVSRTQSRISSFSNRLTLWYIPISFTTAEEKYFSATAPRLWMEKVRDVTIEDPTTNNNETWILVNPHQTAFYRVNYDIKNWVMLKRAFESGNLPKTTRAQLLDDALFFGRNGILDYTFVMDMTKILEYYIEAEYTVWKPLLRHFSYIRNILILQDGPTENDQESLTLTRFKKYVRKLITPVFNYLNSKYTELKNLDHNDKLLRADIFLWACAVDNSECKIKARAEFDKWKNSQTPEYNPIVPDMRYPILCSIMAVGGSSDYEFLVERYLKTPETDPDKYVILRSLLCRQKEESIKFLLSVTVSGYLSLIRLNRIQDTWKAVMESFYPSPDPFQFFLSHWEVMSMTLSDYHTLMLTIVRAATINTCTKKELKELIKFKDDNVHHFPWMQHAVDDAIRRLQDRLAWGKKPYKAFRMWIITHTEDNNDERTQKLTGYKVREPEYRSELSAEEEDTTGYNLQPAGKKTMEYEVKHSQDDKTLYLDKVREPEYRSELSDEEENPESTAGYNLQAAGKKTMK